MSRNRPPVSRKELIQMSKSLFKIYQNAIPAHLFPLGRVDLT